MLPFFDAGLPDFDVTGSGLEHAFGGPTSVHFGQYAPYDCPGDHAHHNPHAIYDCAHPSASGALGGPFFGAGAVDDAETAHPANASALRFGGYYNADGTYYDTSDNTDRDPETQDIIRRW